VLAIAFRPYRLMLLMDGCQHLQSDCAAFASRLLMRCPHLTVLATSRAGLGIEGETTLEVGSLGVPPVFGSPSLWGPPRLSEEQRGTAAIEQLLRSDSVQLFVQRAAVASPGFALAQENASAIVHLCRLLRGIPLAVELAAARAAELPLEHIAEQLSHALQSVNPGRQTLPSYYQTLFATLDWSYKLLCEFERQLLLQFANAAANRFAPASGRDKFDRVGARPQSADQTHLERLIALSLVFVQPELAEPAHVGLSNAVREYIAERGNSFVSPPHM
jgi:predicted ATPase